MKKIQILLVLALSFASTAFADEVEVVGTVANVTLFQDRAEISRQAEAKIPTGKSIVRFTAVPQAIEPESLRVTGVGAETFTILSVDHRSRFVPFETSPRARELEQKIEALNREIGTLEQSKSRIAAQRALIEKVSLTADIPAAPPGQPGQAVTRPRTAAEMAEVLKFVSDSIAKLDQQNQVFEQTEQDKSKELQVLQQEINQLRPSRKTESAIEVAIYAPAPVTANLLLTYQVHGASWQPSYNLDVREEDQGVALKLSSYAIIRQSTGEDWKNIKLTLSTARPQVGLNRPTPNPVVLDIRPSFEAQVASGAISQMKALRKMPAATLAGAPMDDRMEEEAAKDKAEEMNAVEQSAEVIQGVVVSYKIPGDVTIKSDGSTEKIKVGERTLEGSIVNVAVPALTSEVYREAKFKSSEEQPLLPGTVSVFSEGSFVGNQFISYTPPNKELSLAVGTSTTVTAKRTQKKKFEDDSGVVRSVRRIAVDYSIDLENLSKHAEQLIVLEPGTISRNEKITVKTLKVEPPALLPTDEKRIAKVPGVVEWQLQLAPQAKQTLVTETSVEFPADLQVSGMEGL